MPGGAEHAAQIDPVMGEEPPVLDRDHGADEVGRQMVGGQLLAAIDAARGEGLAGTAGVNHGGRGFCCRTVRQR